MKNKSIQIILAILFCCLGLYIAFRGIEWTNFFTEIRSVSLPWYIGGMFGMLLVLFIRGLKWKLLLKPLREYKVMNLYKGTTAGFFTNYVLPFRMGEIARAYITGNIIGQ